jgi:hypothetical protein
VASLIPPADEAENAKPEDLAAGSDLLLQVMVARAGVVG